MINCTRGINEFRKILQRRFGKDPKSTFAVLRNSDFLTGDNCGEIIIQNLMAKTIEWCLTPKVLSKRFHSIYVSHDRKLVQISTIFENVLSWIRGMFIHTQI